MAFEPFVPLRVLSSYSMLEGAIDPKAIAKLAKERGFPAIAIADRNGLYAAMSFAGAARDAGIQPIIGTLLGVRRDAGGPIDWLPLYAQNETGWNNLCHLVSRAHLDRPLELDPHVTFADLEGHSDGLICLTGAGEGALVRLLAEGRDEAARDYCTRLEGLFPGRLYIEIARRDDPAEEAAEEALIDLAYARDLPLVATNPASYGEPAFYGAHDAMLCIANSTHVDAADRPRSNPQWWVKSWPMMREAFEDLPEATANTLVIAQRCAFAPPKRKPLLPSLAGDREGEERMLVDDARAGLEKRLEPYGEMSAEERQVYFDRLDFEAGIINKMGFAGYFLIVADFIKWAKNNGVPVGPGRGSGAGSLVAYVLEITGLDPLRYDLLFERFLNPERVSMPDFDIDFCMEGRDRVIQYVAEAYGRDQVSQIITFGTMAAKAVVRDCGRVLGHGYGFVDSIAKLIPPTLGIKLSKAIEEEPQLKNCYDAEEEVHGILDRALSLEGLVRNAGTHAGGVVIAPTALTEYTALYVEPGGQDPVTQFDKDDVEAVGLVKFDFLGLRTLTIIDWAVRAVNEGRAKRGEELLDLDQIPLDDAKSFKLLCATQTTAVFQLESRGMKDLIRRLQPDSFDDIVALVALFRPGPLESGMVGDYIDRKHGRSQVEYPHPKLESILKPTYGVILYQEQVMQIAQVLAGYTLGAADILRRAMGKKKPEEMAKQREIFVAGSTERGVDEALANRIFDLMETFAGYGFNKSHSVAYALLAYQTAYLKDRKSVV